MAIIACPSCAKQISDKHQQCPHCEININNLDNEEKKRIASEVKLKKKQQIMNHSFIALIIFLSGFLVLYTRAPEQDSVELLISQSAIAIGFVWYLINRIRLLFVKKTK